MKNIRVFLSENFQFLEVKFSIYLNRRVFVVYWTLVIKGLTIAKGLSMGDNTLREHTYSNILKILPPKK